MPKIPKYYVLLLSALIPLYFFLLRPTPVKNERDFVHHTTLKILLPVSLLHIFFYINNISHSTQTFHASNIYL